MALDQYKEAAAERQRMADLDPTNLDYQRESLRADLKVLGAKAAQSVWSKVANYNVEQWNAGWELWKPSVIDAATKSQEILRKAKLLAAKDPGNMAWQSDLALRYSQCGDMLMRTVLLHMGKKKMALQYYDRALEIRKRLADADPNSTPLQYWVALSRLSRAGALRRLSRYEEAAEEARQALQVFKALASRWPGNVVFLEGPRAAKKGLSALPAINREQLKDALKATKPGFIQARELAARDSATEKDIADYSGYCSELAVAHFFRGATAQALEKAWQAADLWKRLSPGASHDPSYRTNRTAALVALGAFQLFDRQTMGAIDTARQGLALDSSRVEFKAILALGCLIQGQFEEARAVLLENKNLEAGLSQTFPEAVLDDLRRLRERGVVSSELLKNLEQRLASDLANLPQ
jgi:hypothetical protein